MGAEQPQPAHAELEADRQDLLAVLRMRFGNVAPAAEQKIRELADAALLGRLILVAANAASLEHFISELVDSGPAFRIVGAAFDPLSEKARAKEAKRDET